MEMKPQPPRDLRHIDSLLQIMNCLRDPQHGCPWDIEQDFASIAPYTIEEAYEVADAISRHDMPGLADELGDLLLQVVFHAQMAHEKGAFTFADVVSGVCAKMIRRHPHVFTDRSVKGAAAVKTQWETIKARERRQRETRADTSGTGPLPAHSALDGVARALPGLLRAQKLQKRAAMDGFDWHDLAGVLAKVGEEIDEIAALLDADGNYSGKIDAAGSEGIAGEIGDLLFSLVNVARHLGLDAETVMQRNCDKFTARFQRMEGEFTRRGVALSDASPEMLEASWQKAKKDDQEQ